MHCFGLTFSSRSVKASRGENSCTILGLHNGDTQAYNGLCSVGPVVSAHLEQAPTPLFFCFLEIQGSLSKHTNHVHCIQQATTLLVTCLLNQPASTIQDTKHSTKQWSLTMHDHSVSVQASLCCQCTSIISCHIYQYYNAIVTQLFLFLCKLCEVGDRLVSWIRGQGQGWIRFRVRVGDRVQVCASSSSSLTCVLLSQWLRLHWLVCVALGLCHNGVILVAVHEEPAVE